MLDLRGGDSCSELKACIKNSLCAALSICHRPKRINITIKNTEKTVNNLFSLRVSLFKFKFCHFKSDTIPLMLVKPLIYIVIILILLSLASSLFFLFKDQGQGKRSVYSLGIRVSLGAILLMLVVFGLSTGELGN